MRHVKIISRTGAFVKNMVVEDGMEYIDFAFPPPFSVQMKELDSTPLIIQKVRLYIELNDGGEFIAVEKEGKK